MSLLRAIRAVPRTRAVTKIAHRYYCTQKQFDLAQLRTISPIGQSGKPVFSVYEALEDFVNGFTEHKNKPCKLVQPWFQRDALVGPSDLELSLSEAIVFAARGDDAANVVRSLILEYLKQIIQVSPDNVHVENGPPKRTEVLAFGTMGTSIREEYRFSVELNGERLSVFRLTTFPESKGSLTIGYASTALLSLVREHKRSLYDSSLLAPLTTALKSLIDSKGSKSPTTINDSPRSFRVIVDHLRTAVALASLGVSVPSANAPPVVWLPSNSSTDDIMAMHGLQLLRLLIRRATRHAHRLGFGEPFLYSLVAEAAKTLPASLAPFTENARMTQDAISREISQEELLFYRTFHKGNSLLDRSLKHWSAERSSTSTSHDRTLNVPTHFVHRMFSEFGFPIELTREISSEHGWTVDSRAAYEYVAAFSAKWPAHQHATADTAIFPASLSQKLSTLATQLIDPSASTATIVTAISDDPPIAENAESSQRARYWVVLDPCPFAPKVGAMPSEQGVLRFTENPDGAMAVVVAVAPSEGRPVALLVETTPRDISFGVLAGNDVAALASNLIGRRVLCHVDTVRRNCLKAVKAAVMLLERALAQICGPQISIQLAYVDIASGMAEVTVYRTGIAQLGAERRRAVEELVHNMLSEELILANSIGLFKVVGEQPQQGGQEGPFITLRFMVGPAAAKWAAASVDAMRRLSAIVESPFPDTFEAVKRLVATNTQLEAWKQKTQSRVEQSSGERTEELAGMFAHNKVPFRLHIVGSRSKGDAEDHDTAGDAGLSWKLLRTKCDALREQRAGEIHVMLSGAKVLITLDPGQQEGGDADKLLDWLLATEAFGGGAKNMGRQHMASAKLNKPDAALAFLKTMCK